MTIPLPPLPEPEWLERKGLIFDPLDEDIAKPACAPLYTSSQMRAYAAQASADERERCIKACEDDAFVDQWKGLAEAARRIRALEIGT